MKILVKGQENREAVEIVSLDMLVPGDHLLRKIEAAVDFDRIYEFVDDLYCKDNRRPSIDPVVLFIVIQQITAYSHMNETNQSNRIGEW